ncbi:MAG: hypothetical protein H0W96_02565 [Solirubrobacterales bacterium]|nr:hypothetical protein [Solirubrobacterales bacterium]
MSEAAIAATAAFVVLAVNGVAGTFAAWRWWQVLPSDAVWPLLRAGQVAAGLQALLAGVLFAAGYRPGDELFWLYALLPVAIGLIAEQLRIAAAEQVLEDRELPDAQAVGALPESEQRSIVLAVVRREIGVMALAALVVAFLALRAALIA